MSVIKQPFQMLPFSTSIEFQWRLRSDCFNDICDVPVIPKGKFVPFAIITNSDNVGAITLHCWDEPFSYTRAENFTKNNCESGSGSIVSYSKIYYSSISYIDARNQAMADPNYLIEGQQYANENGECISVGNTEQSQVFTRNNCGEETVGTDITYTVLANTYFAATQDEANQLALNDITLNGQAYADANGECISRYLINITYHDTEPEGESILDGGITLTGQSGVGYIEWLNTSGISRGHMLDPNASLGAVIDITFNLDILKSRNLIPGKTYRMLVLNSGSSSPACTKTYFMDGIGTPSSLNFGTSIQKDFVFNNETPLKFIIRFEILSNSTLVNFTFSNISLKQID